jgi:hypothetical protein
MPCRLNKEPQHGSRRGKEKRDTRGQGRRKGERNARAARQELSNMVFIITTTETDRK